MGAILEQLLRDNFRFGRMLRSRTGDGSGGPGAPRRGGAA